jgi:hypothetical protein
MQIVVQSMYSIGSFVLVSSLFVLGCGRSESNAQASDDAGAVTSRTTSATTRIGSCDRVAITGTCSEYAGKYLADNEVLLTSSCAKLGGTFVYTECPNTSVIGSCTLSTSEVRKFYGAGAAAWDPERARSECVGSFGGSWQAR